ncbi:hypothetical protein NF27_FM00050 [Candidatus Jidaibacter acanthamoeba]|uniref:Uncharacterized protein n=1 Tax=Candidatus Jidaibacter acanthamoebae TaxID=86105 RepID=A0A0C1MY63_9RICK|nr:tetratricopeptide repeat protein [Candidatus Jidaibacter acanthamoeba]KIE04871.1 hypothetical protein NF27_FM00050 [Candidatus Jidaibacter acanthamoeba]
MRAVTSSNKSDASVQDISGEENINTLLHKIVTSLFIGENYSELRWYIKSVNIGVASDKKWDTTLYNHLNTAIEEYKKERGAFSKYKGRKLVEEVYSFVTQQLDNEKGYQVTERTKKLCEDILEWEAQFKTMKEGAVESLGSASKEDEEYSKNTGKKLRDLSAAGDDRNLINHGGDRRYWYSVTDGFRLLVAIRKSMLRPIDIEGREEERYTTHRENEEGIFIADPYHSDNFNQYLRDDIARITGNHEIEEYNNDRWQSMPRVIVLPILYGLHWRSVRIEIDYNNRESSILYDDPYGVGHFPKQEMERLLEVIKEQIRILIRTELGAEEIEIKVKEYEKKIDQQESYENSYDCGVIVFSNIRDYSRREIRNEVYAEASGSEVNIYSLSPTSKNKHEEEVVGIRARHIRECGEIVGIEINTDRLEEIEESIRQSSKNRVDRLVENESNIGKKISELPSEYIEMLFSILEQKKPLGETGEYIEEELEECYGLLFKKVEEEINLDFIEKYIGKGEGKEDEEELGDKVFLNVNETLRKIEGIREEVNKLYEVGDIEDCLKKIKEGLKLCNNEINAGKYYEQEYELFLKLGDIYYKGENRLDYPNAVGIYQYMLNIIDRLPDGIDKEGRKKEVENKIGLVEEEFIKQYSNGKVVSKEYSGEASLRKTREYKTKLEEHREWAKGELKKIEEFEEGLEKRAKEVERIYGEIREYFIGGNGLIKQLLNDCIKELGGLPKVIDKRTGEEREVEYAIFGMGSMALGTMTPWSDMEWGILIEEGLEREENKVKEYFRNLTVIMYIKLICFGESLLTVPGIKELNNFKLSDGTDGEHNWFYDRVSRRGFSFDGSQWHACKSPLGRENGYRKAQTKEHGGRQEIIECDTFELIGTVGELIKFQEKEKWWKEDKELVQALWHIVQILGSTELIENYQNKLVECSEKIRERSFEILKQDNLKLNPFSQVFNLEKEGQILNVKKEIYRFPDRIAVALVDILGGNGRNAWEAIESLAKKESKGISIFNSESMQIALSIATELRLRAYAHNNSQREDLSALIRYELQIEGFKEAATEKIFYIKNLEILYKYYYITLPLSHILRNIDSTILLNDRLNEFGIYMEESFTKGFIFKRFLKYHDAIKELENVDCNTEEEYFYIKSILGELYFKTGKNNEAYGLYMEMYERENSKGQETDNHVISTILSGIVAALYNLGRYKEALVKCEECLKIGKGIYGVNNLHIANTLNLKGGILIELGKLFQAKQYFRESLKIRQEIYEERIDHIDIAASLSNFASICENLGEYTEAYDNYQKSLGMLMRIYKGEHPTIAALMNNLGATLESLAKYEEALLYYQEGLKISRKIYQNKHYAVIYALNNITNILRKLGRYEEALEHQEESQTISLNVFNKDNPYLAVTLDNKGMILQELSRYNEALEIFQKSYKIRKKIHNDKKHNDIAISLDNIGSIYRELSMYEEALKAYEEALEIRKGIYKEIKHPDVAGSLNNIGSVLLSLGKYNTALEKFEHSLMIRKEIYPNMHPRIAESLGNIGEVLVKLNNYEGALKCYDECLEIERTIYKGDHHSIAKSLNNIGSVFGILAQYDKALANHQESLEISRRIYKGNHTVIAESLCNIGNTLLMLRRVKEAAEYYKESLKIMRRVYKKNNFQIATLINNIGGIKYCLGEYEEALKEYQDSLGIRREIYKENMHPDIAESLNNIGMTLIKLGRYKEAYNATIQSLKIYEDLQLLSNTNTQIVFKTLQKSTIGLANQLFLANEKYEAVSLYNTLGVESDNLEQVINILGTKFLNDGEIILAVACYEVLSEKLLPQSKIVKHNLACIYHVMAIDLKKRNKPDKYKEHLSKAKTLFESILNMESEEPINAALYTEYAMFLVKYHSTTNQEEYIKIEKLLNKAIEIRNDNSELAYSQLEKLTVIEILQSILNKHDNIIISPNVLAYNLLVKVHKEHGEVNKAKEILKDFAIEVMKIKQQGAEIPLTLLINSYEELGFKFQSRIYQEILVRIVENRKDGLEK